MTRRFIPAVAVVVAVLLLPATAFSQVTKTKDGYLLRMKWKKGDVFEYAVNSTVEMSPGAPLTFSSDYSMTVLTVKGKIAQVTHHTLDPISNEPTEVTVEMNDRGIADKQIAEAMSKGSSQFGFQYPEKPLKVGDTWEDEQPTSIMNVEVNVLTKYRFEGLEIISKVPCVKLSVIASAKMSGEMEMSIDSKGVIYIENRTGQLYKSTLEMTILLDPKGAAMKIPSTTEIKRK